MGFSHPYGAYNVEGTLNEWFKTNLTAWGVPAWMPSARVEFDWPEKNLISGYSGHTFTVTHLGAPEPIQQYQGRVSVGNSAGQTMMNIVEINCWVSKQQAGGQYEARLRQMGDMVTKLFTSAREVEIKNLYTGLAAPTGIKALIRLSPAEGRTVVNPDPGNPDYHRRRYQVTYTWVERV